MRIIHILQQVAVLAAVLLAPLAVASPAQAQWLKAESPRFVVYGNGSESELREYVEQLETFEALLRALHGMNMRETPPRPLQLYLARDLREMRRIRPGSGESLGGFYAAGPDVIFGVANEARERNARSSYSPERGYVIRHEYVHHFMLQHFPFAYPSWVIEGYAEYFMTAHFEPDAVLVGRPMRPTTTGARDMPLETLLAGSPWEFDAELRSIFYAQSWLLTHYLISDDGRRRMLGAYLQDVAEGGDPVAAMETATGMPLATLQRELRDYRLPVTRYPTASIPQPEITISRLPRSANDLLLEDVQLRWRHPQRGENEDLLNTIRARAARHQDDEFARMVLARAEIRLGDRAAGEGLARQAIADDPEDVEALHLLASSLMERAAREPDDADALNAEARRYLATGYAADPEHFQTLYAIARNGGGRMMPAPEHAAEAYLAALEVAPQVSQLRLETGVALLGRDQLDYGEHVLAPLLHTPHAPDVARVAQNLVEAARAGRSLASVGWSDDEGDEEDDDDEGQD